MKKRIRAIVLASQTRMMLMAVLWLALFAYAGRPLLAGAAAIGLAPAAAWGALLILAALPAISAFTRRAQITSYAILAIMSTLLVLTLAGDLVRGAWFVTRLALATHPLPLLDPRALSLGILAAGGALSLLGFAQARCPRLRRVSVPIENLPAELEGYRIVQWSDVHVGPTIQRRFVQSLVERTNALDADAIAITGDFVDGPLGDCREHVAPLRGLHARDGVFYVTGNHEYYWRASEGCRSSSATASTFSKTSTA